MVELILLRSINGYQWPSRGLLGALWILCNKKPGSHWASGHECFELRIATPKAENMLGYMLVPIGFSWFLLSFSTGFSDFIIIIYKLGWWFFGFGNHLTFWPFSGWVTQLILDDADFRPKTPPGSPTPRGTLEFPHGPKPRCGSSDGSLFLGVEVWDYTRTIHDNPRHFKRVKPTKNQLCFLIFLSLLLGATAIESSQAEEGGGSPDSNGLAWKVMAIVSAFFSR